MATVYLARDLRHKRLVALKVLAPELGAGLGPERFRREIETVARLEHPHILPVLDSGEVQTWLWYTMPFVEGESLRDRVERERQLPVEEALRLTREAADALEYAHSQGVVHRDIKPENILLSRGHARVADFGIARALEAAAGGERLTATGITVGTPAYMSPEQAAGGAVDGRTDVYSLGCVLYEMLAGEPPFTGPTPQAVIARRFMEPAPSVRLLRAAVPAAVEAALTRALAREPVDRFQTAAEFAEALALSPTAPSPAPARQAQAVSPPAHPSGRRRLPPIRASLLALGLVLGLGVLFASLRSARGGGAASNPKLLAVLPFENLDDTAEAHFADGVSDAVRGKLAALPGLQVIAGASSGEYRRTTKSPREIARELGVRYLLIGKVRREGGTGVQVHVRVSPELVEVRPRRAPTTKWQEPFEAPLADVFQVQADIARGVAEALGVPLGAGQRLQLAEPLTRNLPAYNAYLRGEEISKRLQLAAGPAALRQALPYYEQAVVLDSGFVQAWAQLARAHSLIYAAGGTLSSAEAEAARTAAERALALGPDRPEGRLALGDYYLLVPKDNRRALEQYTLGLRVAPNHVELLSSAGIAEQYLGRWDAALEHFRRAYALDPRSVDAARTLAYALLLLRHHAEALAAADRTLALAPTDPNFVELKSMIYLAQGDLPKARAVVRSALKQADPAVLVAFFGYAWDLYWVLEEPEQQLLLRLPPSAFDNNRASWGLILAQTYALRGDQARARLYADSARVAFEEQLREAPQDGQLHALYGLALAYLGQKVGAVREGERGVALTPVSEHGLLGAYIQHQLVRIYLLAGEPEKALDRLEPLLKIPYYLSPGWLKTDPTFAPLRGNPRFERLVKGS